MMALILAATIATTPAPLCRVEAGRLCCPVILISRLVADRDAKGKLLQLERERCDKIVAINLDAQRAREKALADDSKRQLAEQRKRQEREKWIWLSAGAGGGAGLVLVIVLVIVFAKR